MSVGFVRLSARRDSFGFQMSQDERVDRIAHPGRDSSPPVAADALMRLKRPELPPFLPVVRLGLARRYDRRLRVRMRCSRENKNKQHCSAKRGDAEGLNGVAMHVNRTLAL